ncbi:MAG: peroxidase-related enzyme [Pseudomonadota bacterium]
MNQLATPGTANNIGDILLANPERFGPILTFAQHMMRGSGALDKADRELLVAYVSALNACSYCHGVHAATAEKFGVKAELLETLLADGTLYALDARLRPIFAFAHKLMLEPAQMTIVDRQVILQTGFDQAVIGDVIAIAALFSFFNR